NWDARRAARARLAFEQRSCLARDRELFIRSHDDDPGARAIFRNHRKRLCGAELRIAVAILIEHGAQELEALRAAMTNECAVLADAAGECDRIDPAHDRRVRADVLAHAMRVERDRKPTAFVAF